MIPQRIIVCAANRSRSTGRIICGARHWDSIMRQHCVVNGKLDPEWVSAEQGFIDQHGVWLTRQEAYVIAQAANQIKYPATYQNAVLFSEDLY